MLSALRRFRLKPSKYLRTCTSSSGSSVTAEIFVDDEDVFGEAVEATTPLTVKQRQKLEQQKKKDAEKWGPKNPFPLTPDEVLYLAKEAGYFTVKEKQALIMRSPPFSPNKNPFVLENFYDTLEQETPQDVYDPPVSDEDIRRAIESKEIDHTVDAQMDALLSQGSDAYDIQTFTYNGRTWRARAEGVGTRNRATARVLILKGSGKVKVNGEEDFYWRWPLLFNRLDVMQPFYLTKTCGLFDVFIQLAGGGISGQALAARLAIGRALVSACPSCSQDMKEDLVLYEDVRQKMSKMPGRLSARAIKNWSKR